MHILKQGEDIPAKHTNEVTQSTLPYGSSLSPLHLTSTLLKDCSQFKRFNSSIRLSESRRSKPSSRITNI